MSALVKPLLPVVAALLRQLAEAPLRRLEPNL